MSAPTPPAATDPTSAKAAPWPKASRETDGPTLVRRELFLGRLDLDLIHPHPEPDAEEQKRAKVSSTRFERFLREEVERRGDRGRPARARARARGP